MGELKLRRRKRLRKKEVAALKKELEDLLGCTVFSEDRPVETGEAGELKVIVVDNRIMGFYAEGRPFLSLRGVLEYGPTRCHVVVDSGAVPYVYNGADIMAPGVIAADGSIKKGEPVWIKEEKYGKALAVGIALMDGPEMVAAKSGKAAKSVLYVGDKVWRMDE
jgi:PUA domain protein